MAVSKERFEQVVESAKFLIQLKINSHKAELLNEGRSLVDAILFHKKIYGVLEKIVSFADKRPDVHGALIEACAVLLDIDNELPAPLKNWLVSYLKGQAPRPNAKRGRKPGKVQGKADGIPKIYLGSIVDNVAKDYQLKTTRSDASRVHRSACDAVAKATVQLGLYDAHSEENGNCAWPYPRIKLAYQAWCRDIENKSKS